MARKLSKSSKQILSVLFHLAVLVSMVIAYDAVKLIVDKVRTGSIANADEEKGKDAGFMQKLDDLYKGMTSKEESAPK